MVQRDDRAGSPSVFILGCGAVGSALAAAFRQHGVTVIGGYCRGAASAQAAEAFADIPVGWGEPWPVEAMAEADVLITSVPDPVIGEVAERLASEGVVSAEQVVLHCSGARGAEALAPLRGVAGGVAAFHPLLSFASPSVALSLLPQATFAVDGEGAALVRAGELAATLGASVVVVPSRDRPLYHAAAATASNHLVALAAQATAMLESIGLDGDSALKALLPLMRSTLANLESVGLPDALTGPVSRGDAECVEGHLAAISEGAPGEETPYRAMAGRALEVARAKGGAASEAFDAVERVLRPPLRSDE